MYIIDKHAYKERNMLATPENTYKFRVFTCAPAKILVPQNLYNYHLHVSWDFPRLTSLSRVGILVPGTIIPSQKVSSQTISKSNAKNTHKHVYIYK